MAEKPIPGWPRGMPEATAAQYVGLSTGSLRSEVKAGLISTTKLTPGRIVYLREELDRYLDAKAGVVPAVAQGDGSEWMAAFDKR